MEQHIFNHIKARLNIKFWGIFYMRILIGLYYEARVPPPLLLGSLRVAKDHLTTL